MARLAGGVALLVVLALLAGSHGDGITVVIATVVIALAVAGLAEYLVCRARQERSAPETARPAIRFTRGPDGPEIWRMPAQEQAAIEPPPATRRARLNGDVEAGTTDRLVDAGGARVASRNPWDVVFVADRDEAMAVGKGQRAPGRFGHVHRLSAWT
jgi:hypothetical protein